MARTATITARFAGLCLGLAALSGCGDGMDFGGSGTNYKGGNFTVSGPTPITLMAIYKSFPVSNSLAALGAGTLVFPGGKTGVPVGGVASSANTLDVIVTTTGNPRYLQLDLFFDVGQIDFTSLHNIHLVGNGAFGVQFGACTPTIGSSSGGKFFLHDPTVGNYRPTSISTTTNFGDSNFGQVFSDGLLPQNAATLVTGIPGNGKYIVVTYISNDASAGASDCAIAQLRYLQVLLEP